MISCIVNVHDEGSLSRATLESALAAIGAARQSKLEIELVIVADTPTGDTREVLAGFQDRARIVDVRCGDLGLSRNHGVQSASGEFVAFLDGDDLWTRGWLVQAHQAAAGRPQCIVHPHYNLIFGCGEDHIYEHVDMADPGFDPRYLIFDNYWLSPTFARRSIFQRVPYSRNAIGSGFGFEDWKWNCDTFRAGCEHIVAKDTLMLIRRRYRSLRQRSVLAKCLMTPSARFFERCPAVAAEPPVD
jgi:glycosyltransferase involved in cell wall biosynthesis